MDATNDNFLKVTGSVNIPVPLDIDTEYQFTGVVSVYGEDNRSKQDGSYSHTFKAQFVGEISLIKGDQVILGEKKSSWSQKWRRLVEGKGYEYNEFMQWQFGQFEDLEERFLRK
jgi:hypothetical protein